MKTISYYDLLNMVKNNEYPSVYYHCSNGYKILYVPEFDDVDKSFICYGLKNNKEYREEYARYYLAENILESEMFENNLEIIEDTPKEDKKIEKLESYISCGWCGTCEDLKRDDLFNDLKKMGNKINEIIDKLNKGA